MSSHQDSIPPNLPSRTLFGVSAADLLSVDTPVKTPSSPSEIRAALVNAVRDKDPKTLGALLASSRDAALNLTGQSRHGLPVCLFELCMENFDARCADLLVQNLDPFVLRHANLTRCLGGSRFCTPETEKACRWLSDRVVALTENRTPEEERLTLFWIVEFAFDVRFGQQLPSIRSAAAQSAILNLLAHATDRLASLVSSVDSADPRADYLKAESARTWMALSVMALTFGDADRCKTILGPPGRLEKYTMNLHQTPKLTTKDHIAGLLMFVDTPQAAAIHAPERIAAANADRTSSPAHPDGVPLIWTLFERSDFGQHLLTADESSRALVNAVALDPNRMRALFKAHDVHGNYTTDYLDLLSELIAKNGSRLGEIVDGHGDTALHQLAKSTYIKSNTSTETHRVARFLEAMRFLPANIDAKNSNGLTPIELLPDAVRTRVERHILEQQASSGVSPMTRRF